MKRFESIYGWFAPDEGQLLYKCAMEAPTLPFLEIGSYSGKSSCYLAMAAKERGLKVYCVDLFVLDRKEADFWKTLHSFDLADVVTLLVRDYMNPFLLAELSLIGKFGLIHIDGDHTYESVRTCLRYISLLTKGGMLLLHDYKGFEGVQRNANKIKSAKNYELIGETGPDYWGLIAFRRK